MNKKENSLIIFLKYPEPGKVKTRLADDIGKINAANLYKSFVENLLKKTKSNRFERCLFFSPHDKASEIQDWLGDKFIYYPQEGRDLGERMANAFKLVFEKGAERAVIIGTDCPIIDSKRIDNAFKHLNCHQCVIGPSEDGGYYLLGLNKIEEDLFYGIEWSKDSVFVDTMKKVYKKGLSINVLEKAVDIDTKEDLINYREELK